MCKTKFIEMCSLSLNDYNLGNIPAQYFVQDQQSYLKDYEDDTRLNDYYISELTKKLENIISESNSGFSNVLTIQEPYLPTKRRPNFCFYQGNCPTCEEGSDYKNAAEYCLKCEMCNAFRDLVKKTVKEIAKEVFDVDIKPKLALVKKSTGSISAKREPIIVNQITNNMYIHCNSLEVNIELPYFITNDNIFYVTIEINRSNTEEMIKNLKYIFTCLMCGVKGKSLFPEEEKYSLASTVTVSAALYTIKNAEIKPILHGLIKYQKNESSSVMTIKKLQSINKTNMISKRPIIKASLLPLWENKKHHYCTKSIKDAVKTITSTQHYGSDVDDFLS